MEPGEGWLSSPWQGWVSWLQHSKGEAAAFLQGKPACWQGRHRENTCLGPFLLCWESWGKFEHGSASVPHHHHWEHEVLHPSCTERILIRYLVIKQRDPGLCWLSPSQAAAAWGVLGGSPSLEGWDRLISAPCEQELPWHGAPLMLLCPRACLSMSPFSAAHTFSLQLLTFSLIIGLLTLLD